jgi:SET and MYND domain-containing protein
MSIESPEGMGTVIGSSLDLYAAGINHSCDPNSAVFFEGQDLRVRSIRAIAPEEEITISYIDPNWSFNARQEQLASKYHFICKCTKCEKGACRPGDLITGNDEVDRRIKEAQNQLRTLLDSKPDAQPIEDIEAAANRICAEGYPGKPWPCDVSPTPYLQIVFAQIYQKRENWPKTFAFQLKISFETDPLIWPSQYGQRRVQNFMNYVRVET